MPPPSTGKGPSDFQNVLAEEERQAQELLTQINQSVSVSDPSIMQRHRSNWARLNQGDTNIFDKTLGKGIGAIGRGIQGIGNTAFPDLPLYESPEPGETIGSVVLESLEPVIGAFDASERFAMGSILNAFAEKQPDGTLGPGSGRFGPFELDTPATREFFRKQNELEAESGFFPNILAPQRAAPSARELQLSIGQNLGELFNPFIRPSDITPGLPGGPPADFHIGTLDLLGATGDVSNLLPVIGVTKLATAPLKVGARGIEKTITKTAATGVAAKRLTGEVLETGLSATGHRILDDSPQFIQALEHEGILSARGADIRVPLTLPIRPIEAVEAPLKSLPPVTYRLDLENISARGRELFETGRTDRYGNILKRDRTFSHLPADEIKDIHLDPREVLVPNGEVDPFTLKPGDTIGYKDGPGADRFIRLQVADDGSLFRTRRRQDDLAEPKKVKLQRQREGKMILGDLVARLQKDQSLGQNRAFKREIDAGLDMLKGNVAVGRKQQLDRINLEMNVPRDSSPDASLNLSTGGTGEVIGAPALRQEQGALMKRWLHHMPDEYYDNISLSFREGGRETDIDRLTRLQDVVNTGGAYTPNLELIEIFTGNIARLTMRSRNYQQFVSPAETYIHETIHPLYYRLSEYHKSLVREEFERQKFLFNKDIRQVKENRGLWTLTRKQPGDADFDRISGFRTDGSRPKSNIGPTLATTDEYVTSQRFGRNTKNENYRFSSVEEFFSEMLTDKAIRDMMPQDVQAIADKLSSRLKHISMGFWNLLAKDAAVLSEFADKTPITEQIYRMVFQPTGAARMHPIGAFRKGSLSKTTALERIHEMALPGARSNEIQRMIRAGGGIRTEDYNIIDVRGNEVPATKVKLGLEERKAENIIEAGSRAGGIPGTPSADKMPFDRANPVLRLTSAIKQIEGLQGHIARGNIQKPQLHLSSILRVHELEDIVGTINEAAPLSEIVTTLRAANEELILEAQKTLRQIDEIRLIAEEAAIKRGMTSFGVNFPSGDPKFMGIMNEDIDDIILKGGGVDTSEYKIAVYNRVTQKYTVVPAHGWVLKDAKNEAIANLNGNENYPLGQVIRALREINRLIDDIDFKTGQPKPGRFRRKGSGTAQLHRILNRSNSWFAHLDTFPLEKRSIRELLEYMYAKDGLNFDDMDFLPVHGIRGMLEDARLELGDKFQLRLREIESIKYQAEETAFQRGLRNQGLDYKFEPGIIGADDVVDDAPRLSGLLGDDEVVDLAETLPIPERNISVIREKRRLNINWSSTPEGQATLGGDVPRYWYHYPDASQPISADIKAYRIREPEAADTFGSGFRNNEYVWMSPRKLYGNEGYKIIDITKLNNDDMRFTGQVEGNLLHKGDIPQSALVEDTVDDAPRLSGLLGDDAPVTRLAEDARPLTDADHEARIRAIPASERTPDDNAFLASMSRTTKGGAGQPPVEPPPTTTAAPVPDDTPAGTQLRFDLDTGREVELRAKPVADLTDEERQYLLRVGQSRTEAQTKIADSSPNEVLADVSGELDGVLRRAMAKGARALPVDVTSPEAAAILVAQETGIAKIIQGLKDVGAHTFQQRRKSLVAKGREQQVAKGRRAAEGGDPTTAGIRARAAMGGAIIDPTVAPIREQVRLTDVEHRAMMQKIGLESDAPNEAIFYKRLRAHTALGELLEYGLLPNPSDSRLLSEYFGDELGRELLVNRPTRERVIEALGTDVLTLWKPLRSTADISATFRQGAILGARHPKEFKTAFGAQLRAFASESATQAMDVEMRSHAAFEIAVDARLSNPLHISDISEAGIRGSTDSIREEAFSSRLFSLAGAKLRKIPGGWVIAGPFKIIRMSDRAYSTFLNQQRWGVWKTQVEAAQKAGITIDEEFVEALNKWINVASGRGQVGQTTSTRIAAGANIERQATKDFLRQAVKFANIPMFAPLYRISRIQDLNAFVRSGERLARYEIQKVAPGFGRTVTENERFIAKMIAEDMATYAVLATGIAAMVHASGLATVNLNVNSSDFGQMKFGSTRVDLWAGHRQILNLFARLSTGESVGKSEKPYAQDTGVFRYEQRHGRIERFPDRVRKSLRGLDDTVIRYLISGASPGPVSLAVNEMAGEAFRGETFLGENLDDKTQLIFGKYGPETSVRIREAADQQVPFIVNEFADAMIEEGKLLGMLFGTGAFGGFGVTTIPEEGTGNARPN